MSVENHISDEMSVIVFQIPPNRFQYTYTVFYWCTLVHLQVVTTFDSD